MYGFIWRALPGPVWLKTVEALIVIAAIVAILFLWAFPTIAPHLPINQQTVGEG